MNAIKKKNFSISSENEIILCNNSRLSNMDGERKDILKDILKLITHYINYICLRVHLRVCLQILKYMLNPKNILTFL